MEAFESVVYQYRNMIHKIIHSLHIYKNQDDFYQIGLVALWEAHQRFLPEKGEFAPFAYTYIKGRILTSLTSERRNDEKNVVQEEEFWDQIKEEMKIEALPKEIVNSYCSGLTENQKKWVQYTCLYMLTVREIAELEGVSLSAVKKWRQGAKNKIKSNIESGLFL
ncbi:RNA polymerase subunit sigma-24 [Bacillus sp. MKU004]|nr:RNA polymerase subunit sigma-24 [Bacillus sp. MKU004]